MTSSNELPSREMARELREQITSGQLLPGEQLPSERVLAERYGAARNTAREAIRLLADEGLVTVRQGKGAFVRESNSLIRLGSDRYSHKYRGSGLSPFLIECQRQGKVGRFHVLSIDKVKAPREIAELLGIQVDDDVLRRENVFYADDDPVYRVTTYVPWFIADHSGLLQEEIPHQYGIHGIFESKGYEMARSRDLVTTRMPTPDEVTYLRIPSGVPVIDVLHTSVTNLNTAYEVTRFVMRGDMNALTYDVPIEN